MLINNKINFIRLAALFLLLGVVSQIFAQGDILMLDRKDVKRKISKKDYESLIVKGEIISAFGKSSRSADVLLYEDFDGALPAGWTNTVITGPGGFPGWEWTDVGGDYGGQLNSTTAANGYMILDSDAHGTGGVAEEADLITPAIDCSDKDIITLSLEHWARTFGNTDISIYVSTDDFVNETLLYNWSEGVVNQQMVLIL